MARPEENRARTSTCAAGVVKIGSCCRPDSHDKARPVRYDASTRNASGPPTMIMTTADATVAALIARGLDTIYTLPGVHNDPFFDALFKASDRIRTIHTRHEQGPSLMALGAALATGKPQA